MDKEVLNRNEFVYMMTKVKREKEDYEKSKLIVSRREPL